MALQTASESTAPSAQMVGNAFVEQYYHILHTSPELVYRFYQDSSVLSRPDANGVMTSVATMQGINEKILSLNFKDCKAEIKTADAQKSYNDAVTVLVTGCLTGKDDLRRKFAQSFFLAPQDNGYFVLNDVFRYVEDDDSLENSPDSGIVNPSTAPPEHSHVPDLPVPDPVTAAMEEGTGVAERVNVQLDHAKHSVNEKEVDAGSEPQSNGNDVSIVTESISSPVKEDTPKKSYASIVKVAKGSSGPRKVYLPTNYEKVTPKKIEDQSSGSVVPDPEHELSEPSGNDIQESGNDEEEVTVEGHSIYIRNLPYNMTADQLESVFKKFGPIKEGGVQVRYNRQQGYCFGFVEFHSLSSMDNATKASPMTIGGRQAVIEIKRAANRVGSGGGFFPGRGGFRSDSFRGRGNYGGGQGFVRNEYGNRDEFSGRGRGSGGRGGEGYIQGRGGRGRGRGRGRGVGGRPIGGLKPDSEST